MRFLSLFGTVVGLASVATAQTTYTPYHSVGNISSTIVSFPSGFPFTTLLPKSGTNPDGYDWGNDFAWPAYASVGELDGLPGLDIVYAIGERTLLAVGFNRNSAGVPISAYPIWVVHNPSASSGRRTFDFSRPVVWDLDGDGLDEVAWVGIGPGGAHDLEVQVIEDYQHGSLTSYPGHPGIQTPTIAARWNFNAQAPGWEFRINSATASLRCTVADVLGSGGAREVLVSDSQANETKALSYSASLGTLSLVASVPYLSKAMTHDPDAQDLDGDGKDELLSDGVISLSGGASWQYCGYWGGSIPSWGCGTGAWDHADAMAPIGYLDADSVLDCVVVDDYYTKIVPGAYTSGPILPIGINARVLTPSSFLFQNTAAPTTHGQTVSVGRFLGGPDAFSVDGLQAVFCPKGGPFYNGTGQWGTYMANKHLDTLATSFGGSWPVPYNGNGPTGWLPRNIDWDGDVTTDELFNTGPNGLMSVFRLVPATSGSLPYQWQKEAEVDDWPLIGPLPAGSNYPGSSMFANLSVDFFGDEREELLMLGPAQAVFVANSAPYANAGSRRPPWLSRDYRRRFSAPPTRYVDYRALPKLERVEIRPAALAIYPGTSSVPLTTHAVYSDGTDLDVSSQVTLSGGSPSSGISVVGDRVVSNVDVETVLVATTTFAGMRAEPCIARITMDSRPYVLHAGWADTRLVMNAAGDLVMEAAVADPDDDEVLLGLFLGGTLISTAFVDDGSGADRAAGDNIWTLTIPNFTAPAAGDTYFEVVALDMTLQIGNVWPNVNVGGGTAPAVPGFATIPFASESTGIGGKGPRIASLGVLDAQLSPSGVGTVLLGARVTDPNVSSIAVFRAGGAAITGMNDSGTGADQVAGDGLWTLQLTFTSSNPLPSGNHLFDMLGSSTTTPATTSDAYPRLRVHVF